MILTVLEFRQRFSESERIAIELAACDNPSAPQQQRVLAAMLRVYLADLAVAKHVDLARPDTQAGVQQLEAIGMLAPGRAAEILAVPADSWPPVGGYSLGQMVTLKPPFSVSFPGQHAIIGFGPNCVELSMGQFDISNVEPA